MGMAQLGGPTQIFLSKKRAAWVAKAGGDFFAIARPAVERILGSHGAASPGIVGGGGTGGLFSAARGEIVTIQKPGRPRGHAVFKAGDRGALTFFGDLGTRHKPAPFANRREYSSAFCLFSEKQFWGQEACHSGGGQPFPSVNPSVGRVSVTPPMPVGWTLHDGGPQL